MSEKNKEWKMIKILIEKHDGIGFTSNQEESYKEFCDVMVYLREHIHWSETIPKVVRELLEWHEKIIQQLAKEK